MKDASILYSGVLFIAIEPENKMAATVVAIKSYLHTRNYHSEFSVLH